MREVLLAFVVGSSALTLLCAGGCTATKRTLTNVAGSGGATSSSASKSTSATTSGGGSEAASGSSSTAAQSSSAGGSTASSSVGGSTASSSSGGTCTAMDCSDPACTAAGYTCADPVPTGWTGPGVFYLGTSAPPPCGAEWTAAVTLGGTDVASSPATCDACSCEAPSGANCANALVPVATGTSGACAGGMSFTVPFGECVQFQPPNQDVWAQASPAPATGGACTAVGGQASVGTPSFSKQAGFCAAPTAALPGCTTGTCLASPPAGYGSALCIYQTGDVLCPAPTYTNKTVVYGGFKDTRGCSPCDCAPPVGDTCDAQFIFYNQEPGCSGPDQPGPVDGSCTVFDAPIFPLTVSFRVVQTAAPSGGTCAASGGAPAGTVTGAMPVTVCCTQ